MDYISLELTRQSIMPRNSMLDAPIHILEQSADNEYRSTSGHDQKSDRLRWKEAIILKVEDLTRSSRQTNFEFHHPAF
jgi:hypothetical protein